jgi:hypothetical protein
MYSDGHCALEQRNRTALPPAPDAPTPSRPQRHHQRLQGRHHRPRAQLEAQPQEAVHPGLLHHKPLIGPLGAGCCGCGGRAAAGAAASSAGHGGAGAGGRGRWGGGGGCRLGGQRRFEVDLCGWVEGGRWRGSKGLSVKKMGLALQRGCKTDTPQIHHHPLTLATRPAAGSRCASGPGCSTSTWQSPCW